MTPEQLEFLNKLNKLPAIKWFERNSYYYTQALHLFQERKSSLPFIIIDTFTKNRMLRHQKSAEEVFIYQIDSLDNNWHRVHLDVSVMYEINEESIRQPILTIAELINGILNEYDFFIKGEPKYV